MIRFVVAALVLFSTLGVELASAQAPPSFKRFNAFRQIVPHVDFFASNRQVIAPYEKPVAETIARLKSLLGDDLPKGAIFICSTLEQKDSIYEPMVLKQEYGWTLTAITADVRMQEMMARMKSQMGGDLPAEIASRIRNRPPEMLAEAEKQQALTIAQQVAYAVIQTTMNKELRYRSSRVEDMARSPLPDWLDIGIASYAAGNLMNIAFLQQNLDQTFPLEDVIAMSRPFVASLITQNSGNGDGGGRGGMGGGGFGFGGPMGGQDMPGMQGMPMGGQGMPPGMQGMPMGGQGMPGMQGMPMGGQGMPQGGFSGRGGGQRGGGPGGNGGQRGGQRVIPKDEQDRMLFDGQASTIFTYLVEKIGLEKVRELIRQAQEGKESREYLSQPDVLGSDFAKIEQDWIAWVKAQKAPSQPQRQGFPGAF